MTEWIISSTILMLIVIGLRTLLKGKVSLVGLTATTMNYSAKSLKERIRLIARHPKTAAYTLVLVIAIAALAVGCTFTGTPEETTEPTEPPTTPVTEEIPSEVTIDPTEPATDPEDNRQLSYQYLFHSSEDWLYNMAAGIVFTRPQDVDLYYLFYNGVGYDGGWDSVPQSDRDLMVSHGFWQEIDIQIMPAHLLEGKLQRYFGVGLDEMRIPAEWVYSSATDTYYSNHNDAFGSGVTVNGYAEGEDGTVVLYMVVDAVFSPALQDYLWDQPMCMTLRPSEEGWRMVSNVVSGQENMAKIDYYQTLLGWSGGLDYFRALGTIFNTPEDVDLYYFFYNGVDVYADWDEMNEYERELLLAQGFDTDFDIQKLPGHVMEERLQRYFGLGLDAFRIPEEWASDPETETWYSNHSDAWLPYVTVTGVEEYTDGTVRVYLIVDSVHDHTGAYVLNAETVLTLRKTADGGYQMVTHTFAQDVV